jgi:4-hydroxy-tetrahydrodipicolinate synthase
VSRPIQGVLTAIVTPFDPAGEFCARRLRAQVQRQIKHDNGIFCNGTNGEFFVLTREEKLRVTEACVDEVAGKVPVVAHIGEISTTTTIQLGKDLAAMGVDAVSVITPYFVPLKQNELIYHYMAIADAVPVPVFLYNIPEEPATPSNQRQHERSLRTRISWASRTALAVTKASRAILTRCETSRTSMY